MHRLQYASDIGDENARTIYSECSEFKMCSCWCEYAMQNRKLKWNWTFLFGYVVNNPIIWTLLPKITGEKLLQWQHWGQFTALSILLTAQWPQWKWISPSLSTNYKSYGVSTEKYAPCEQSQPVKWPRGL